MDTSVSDQDLQAALSQLGMTCDEPDVYRAILEANLEVTALVDALDMPPRTFGKRSWRKPDPADNPLGAWYVKTEISGAAIGKLAKRSVAVKDTVLLAGVPLMGGSNILEGYVPDQDAEIVTRMLNAGATIAGKSVCEALLFFPVAATPAIPDRCAIHTIQITPVVEVHRALAPWWRRVRWIWRSAAIRAGLSAFPRPIAVWSA